MPGGEWKRNLDTTLDMGYTNKEYTPNSPHFGWVTEEQLFLFILEK